MCRSTSYVIKLIYDYIFVRPDILFRQIKFKRTIAEVLLINYNIML